VRRLLITVLILGVSLLGACGGVSSSESGSENLENIESSDTDVTIVIDKIERASVMPADIVEDLSTTTPYQPPAPAAGHDFFCIYLTVTRIENVHMIDAFGYGGEETALLSTAGQTYKSITADLKGIAFTDPHDITSPSEITEGATAFWVFEVPEDEDPARFELIYTYKTDIEEETENRGEISIVLKD
jgi:hypothetical protein